MTSRKGSVHWNWTVFFSRELSPGIHKNHCQLSTKVLTGRRRKFLIMIKNFRTAPSEQRSRGGYAFSSAEGSAARAAGLEPGTWENGGAWSRPALNELSRETDVPA